MSFSIWCKEFYKIRHENVLYFIQKLHIFRIGLATFFVVETKIDIRAENFSISVVFSIEVKGPHHFFTKEKLYRLICMKLLIRDLYVLVKS